MYTVLLIENTDICNILETEFAQECMVQRTNDHQELLCRLKTDAADIVILDLDSPESRRQESVAQLQSYGQHSTILFLADQAFLDPSHPLTAVSAADYLLRPYTRGELILALEQAIHVCSNRKQDGNGEPVRLSLVRERIEGYIQNHYAENLSMQSVAQVMNYSETHFCRLFKQCFKVNFSAYLNDFRIRQAQQMLRETNQNVKEIALCCGYQDTSYFIRVFKRFTNMTPADYRIYMRSMLRK